MNSADGSASRPHIVVASNRGPFSFKQSSDGSVVPKRGGGGLVTCLAPALANSQALWIAAAMTDGDRQAARQGFVETDDLRLHQLDIDPGDYRRYYDVIANGTLWFLHHNLFDLARRPRIDSRWWEAWNVYCDVNQQFADAIAQDAPRNAVVLIHDYHLTLLGGTLARLRPDLATVHFHHTPFVGRDMIDVLPSSAVHTLLEGLAGHDACGFHSQTWADNFGLCCADELGYVPKTFVSAAAPDVASLHAIAASEECRSATEAIEKIAGNRKLIVRVDRIELSKNLLRGFQSYDDMLRRNEHWRGHVTFAAFIYPSREGLPEYLAYRNEVQGLVDHINDEWGTADWQPIVLNIEDDFPRSLAALMRYDVLLVNPIRDGLNLVSKEGPLVNERNGTVVLSSATGSWHELKHAAIGINPFDITGTSNALLQALEMDDNERSVRATAIRNAAGLRSPTDWLEDQLRSVGR